MVRTPGNVQSHRSPELTELKCEHLSAEGGLLAQPSAVDPNKQHSTVRGQCLGLGGLRFRLSFMQWTSFVLSGALGKNAPHQAQDGAHGLPCELDHLFFKYHHPFYNVPVLWSKYFPCPLTFVNDLLPRMNPHDKGLRSSRKEVHVVGSPPLDQPGKNAVDYCPPHRGMCPGHGCRRHL